MRPAHADAAEERTPEFRTISDYRSCFTMRPEELAKWDSQESIRASHQWAATMALAIAVNRIANGLEETLT